MNSNIKEPGTRFNIMDFLILLCVLLILVGIFFRLNLASRINIGENKQKFEVEFLIQDIQEESQYLLNPGVPFFITTQDIKIGEIKEILEIRDAVSYIEDIDGDIKRSELEGRIDVTGVFTCFGREDENGGTLINGNNFVACGKEYFVHTGGLEVNIMVLNVKKVQ